MTRTYTLKRRAEQQADTRRRIVEATVELHSTVGPARTTFSMIAEKAGVQRHTLYAHFPDERSLFHACSGLVHEERDPLPDAGQWEAIDDRRQRLRVGLRAVYGWYERNAQLMSCVLRDIDIMPMVQEVFAVRIKPKMDEYTKVLGANLSAKQRAILHLALGFFTWRSLARESGLHADGAVEAMIQAIDCADKT